MADTLSPAFRSGLRPILARSSPASRRVHPAVVMLAIHTFVVVARIAELLPSLRLALVTGGLTAALALSIRARSGVRFLGLQEVRTVLGLFFISALTIPFSVWPRGSFQHVFTVYSQVVLIFLLVIHAVRSLRDIRWLVWAQLAAAMSLQLWALAAGSVERLSVTETYDSNDLAFVVVCTIPLGAFLLVYTRSVQRYLAGAVVLSGVTVVVLTSSRGGFLSLLLIGVVLLGKLPASKRTIGFLLVTSATAIFAVFASGHYWNRMATILGGAAPEVVGDYDAEGLWGARGGLWLTGLSLMLNNPILGVGAGAFEVAEGQLHGGVGRWSAPHNSFTQVGAELGLGGLVLFAILIGRAVKNCRAVTQLAQKDLILRDYLAFSQGLEVGLYAFVIAGSSLSHGYSYLAYLLIALAAAMRLVAEREHEAGLQTAPQPRRWYQP
jgi:O-antigen ligase